MHDVSKLPADDLRHRIAARLAEAWPDLADDPVYLDQLAAQAMFVVEPVLAAKDAEVERLRAANKTLVDMMERMPDTHMLFGDATTCADWCWACRVERAEAERDALKAELERLRREIDADDRAISELNTTVTQLEKRAAGWRQRAEQAEARLAELENALAWQTSCTSCARGLDATIKETERAEKAEAAIDRVRERLDTLIADGFGATTPTLRDVRALLDTPAPTDTTGETH